MHLSLPEYYPALFPSVTIPLQRCGAPFLRFKRFPAMFFRNHPLNMFSFINPFILKSFRHIINHIQVMEAFILDLSHFRNLAKSTNTVFEIFSDLMDPCPYNGQWSPIRIAICAISLSNTNVGSKDVLLIDIVNFLTASSRVYT